jgi:tRNA isopentenyl-2-thiomethyl-A-37 hydroxylase MiaE
LNVGARISAFAAREAQLIMDPDPLFRFHSGPPPQTAGTTLQARGSD